MGVNAKNLSTIDRFLYWVYNVNVRKILQGGKMMKEIIKEKFGLFIDLGIITVPDDYVHNTRLASFKKKNRKKFYGWNDDITDENFSKATVQLKPGQKLHVKVFKQTTSGSTTSE
ncbi:hypothetical protein KKF60_00085, partial [Patescibacteria group bacterium]|nr:hypothetical protein [Patescibacteria group bacterium]MCG2695944.1 hypothetical protein [Candidatus Portnoybacteria bacterium]